MNSGATLVSTTPSGAYSWWIWITVLGMYLLLSPAHFLTTQDEELNLRTTLSLLEGKRGAVPPLPGGFASRRGIDGREYAQYGLGLPLAAAPWCALGMAIDPSPDASANSLDHVNETQWAGTPFLRAWITIFSMMITAGTVVLVERMLLLLGFSLSQSLFFSCFFAFGTILLPHGRTFFSEPLTAFCLVLGLYGFLRYRDRPESTSWIILAGLAWTWAILTRVDSLVPFPAAAWFLCIRREDRQFCFFPRVKSLLCFSLPILAGLAFILLYNQYRFDAFLSTGYEDQKEKVRFITPLLVGLQGFLFTPGRSLFLYSPILIFFPWGIHRLYRRDPWLSVGLCLLAGGYLFAMSKWQNWAGGWDWGPRHIYQVTPFLFLFSAAFFLEKKFGGASLQRLGWMVLAGVSILMQGLGLAADPVAAVHEFLTEFTASHPEALRPLVQQFALQYMVYLPQFSNPVLHAQAIWQSGPDLLFLRTAQHVPVLLVWYVIPLLMIVWGGSRLVRALRNEMQSS